MIAVQRDATIVGARRSAGSLIVLLAVGMVCIVLPQSDFFRAVPGDLGDARFNELILEHVLRWLRGADQDLWSPGFFFPFPGALTFSDNHFGSVGVYALLRVAGWTTEGAYIGWFTLAYVANYLCCAYALRRFGLGPHGSAFGAFLFAFAMPVLAQTGHAQLGYRFAIPLAMLALHRLLQERRARHLAWLGIWLTVQFLCSIYLGYFLLLLIGSWLFASAVAPVRAAAKAYPLSVWPEAQRKHETLYCVAMLAACAVTLALLFLPYLHFSRLYGFGRAPMEITNSLPRLGSYLLADFSLVWGALSEKIGAIPMRHEQQLFIGAGACVLVGIGYLRGAAHLTRTAAAALLVLVALTLDVGGLSVYRLLEPLPLANAIRVVSRIILVMLFPLALLAGAGVDWLVAGETRRRTVRWVAASLLTALVVIECIARHAPNVPLRDWRARRSAVLRAVPVALPDDAVLFVPREPGVPAYMTELDGMDLAQRLGHDTINGYSGNSPPGFGFNTSPCDDLTDRLVGYVQFVHGDTAQLAALAKKVVAVGAPLHCEVPASLPTRSHFSGALPNATVGNISVRIADLTVANAHQLRLDLMVVNRGDMTLAAISDSHEPIRFSWRFVEADGAPSRPNGGQGWDTRGNLYNDVPPHGDAVTRLLVDAPTTRGRYRLEVSMVQENVAWFHDRGMPITRGTQHIDVDPTGRVTVAH